MQLTISFFFEVLGLFSASILYYKKRNKLLLYFIPFLFITVSVEFTGWWLTVSKGFGKYILYNIFMILEFVFYSFLFKIHFKKRIFKKMILFFIPLFILLALLNALFIQGANKTFNTYAFLLGSFWIVVFCCCYFYESVLPEQIDQQLSQQPFFWICSGLLIYYLGSVIINALFEYLVRNDLLEEGQRIYKIINNSLNVILYSSFIISFFLCRNHKKISSSQS